MTDHISSEHVSSDDEPDDHTIAAIASLLSRPDSWEQPEPEVEAAVVDAITMERSAMRTTSLDDVRGQRTRPRTLSSARLLGAAAAIALVVAGVALVARGGNDAVVFALSGTEAAPDASAEVTVASTPAGLKILLTPIGLVGAPDGFMYEAWVSDGTIRVSAGTFHFRGGDGTIELWAGVTDPSFDRLAVTLEPIDGDASSSGDARLVGEFVLDD